MDALLRPFLGRLIKRGSLELLPSSGPPIVVGDGGPPACAVRLADRRAGLELLFDPEMAVGELYASGRLQMVRGAIFDLLVLGAQNIGGPDAPRFLVLRQAWQLWRERYATVIAPSRARVNAARHYDLDLRLYRLFLDRDLQYSCAYFESPDMSLDEAQQAKKRHIAAKLALEPGQKVLDIGCGWGGLAIFLARECGVRVLGVTLSREQFETARSRAKEAGLSETVRFALADYREIEGQFDRIVSVGMFEHVGPRHYNAFFAALARLLTPGGVALLHTIGHFRPPTPTSSWIRKYIFPDGYLPSLVEIAPPLARAGLAVADLETLRLHYAQTLGHWRSRFAARREEARALYGEEFCRIWEYYLAASQCAFLHQGCAVMQFQLVKRFDALPITRDYLFAREAALRGARARSGLDSDIRAAG
jgi:cyclopropane-fatty-acyl-phospholipid synthase